MVRCRIAPRELLSMQEPRMNTNGHESRVLRLVFWDFGWGVEKEAKVLACTFVKLDFVAFEIFNHGTAAEFGLGRFGNDSCLEIAEFFQGAGERRNRKAQASGSGALLRVVRWINFKDGLADGAA